MAMGRPKAALVLSPEQRAQLESMASSRSLPAGLVTRVRIVLLSAAGKMNQQIARQLGLTNATVGKWRRRFVEQGVAGLHDELRPGRPRPISDERVAQLVPQNTGDETERRHPLECAAHRRPDPAFEIHGAPHLAGLRAGVAPAAPLQALDRSVFRGEGARHRGTVLASTGERSGAVCGREEPDSGAGTHPAHAAHRLGYVEGVTHDYRRHGTTTLFAALDTAKGTVLTRCRQRHRHQEYLDFLRQIDNNVPPDLDVHVIVDNYATHKHPRVKRWLATGPRFHVHFTPTYASWLNQVEIWFNRITATSYPARNLSQRERTGDQDRSIRRKR